MSLPKSNFGCVKGACLITPENLDGFRNYYNGQVENLSYPLYIRNQMVGQVFNLSV